MDLSSVRHSSLLMNSCMVIVDDEIKDIDAICTCSQECPNTSMVLYITSSSSAVN